MGPQGTGFICVRKDVDIVPMLQGGTGTESKNMSQPLDMPEGFESGTLNVPGVAGLIEGLKYITNRGVRDIKKLEEDLIGCLQEELKDIENIEMYGNKNPEMRTGILAFNIKDKDCEEVASELDIKYGIAVRAGYHCAPLSHATIGTGNRGCVRISVGPFTTYEDIIRAAKAIIKIAE